MINKMHALSPSIISTVVAVPDIRLLTVGIAYARIKFLL